MNNWRWGHCIVNQKWNTNEGSFSFYRDQKNTNKKTFNEYISKPMTLLVGYDN